MLGLDHEPAAVLKHLAAELENRSDDGVADLRADLSPYSSEDVAAARLAWINRVIDEYRSAVLFSELLCVLGDLGASLPVLNAVHHVIGDELRHAKLAATVAEWLGGADDMELDLAGFRPRASESPTVLRALELVGRELVVAEEASMPVHRAYVLAAEDHAIRHVLRILVKDEAKHAAAGRAIFSSIKRRAILEGHSETCERLDGELDSYRQQLEAIYRETSRGGPGRKLGGCISADDLAAGMLTRR